MGICFVKMVGQLTKIELMIVYFRNLQHQVYMKNFVISLFFCPLSLSSFSQDGVRWQIWHNKRQLFSATEENADSNKIIFSSTGFTTKGYFAISFIEENTSAKKLKWIRTIAIYDESDNELYKKASASVKIPDSVMKKMLTANKTIKIYTWSLPKDPAEAARIRVRRVHLCTIVLGKNS